MLLDEITILILGAILGYIGSLAVDHAVLKTRYLSHLEFLHEQKGKIEEEMER